MAKQPSENSKGAAFMAFPKFRGFRYLKMGQWQQPRGSPKLRGGQERPGWGLRDVELIQVQERW